jgi:signal transduction histidine kinase/ligand-binding sensor domain-containing protein
MRLSSAALASLILLASTPARALDPGKELDQYIHDAWGVEDGLPQNSVRAIAQTNDGYLWFGTEEGLVRFDGVRFFTFDKSNTSTLATNLVNAVAVDPEGTLWFSVGAPGLCRLASGDRAACVGRELGVVDALAFDDDGTGWVATRSGLSVWKDGAFEPFSPDRALRFARTPAGRVAILAGLGPRSIASGRIEPFEVPGPKEGGPEAPLAQLLVDRDQSLWVATTRDLFRLHRGHWDRWASPHFERGRDRIMSLFEDAEGSLWIGTGFSGVHRLRDGVFTPYGAGEGLEDEHLRAVFVDVAGEVFAGAESGGVEVLRDGRFRPVLPPRAGETVWAIAKDESGALWVATETGVDRIEDREAMHFSVPGGVISLAADPRHGAMYLGTASRGLAVVEGLKMREGESGVSEGPVHALALDSRGDLWVGMDRGFAIVRDGRMIDRTNLFPRAVYAFHEGRGGSTLIGTRDSGLLRYREREGAIGRLTEREGLFNDTVYTILEDGRGRLWMSSDKGVYAVAIDELDAFFEGERSAVVSVGYDVLDGMPSRECDGPAGARGPDGRLYFPTIRGLASIDPARLEDSRSSRPTPVVIEAMLAGADPIPLEPPIELDPGRDRIEIRYTAASFIAPSRMRFRYRLEGVDRGWVDAGTRRVAFYTNVPPGRHRFSVIAMNASGVWNERGASLEFVLEPRFHQTRAFLVGSVALVLGAIYLGYRLRVRRLEAQKRALVSMIEARTKDLADRNAALDAALSSLRSAQSDLVRAERMASVAALVQGIAHELNNPINFVRGNLEVLRRYAEFLLGIALELADGRPRSELELRALMQLSPKKDLGFVARDLVKVIDDVVEGARRAGLIVSDLQALTPSPRRALEEVDLKQIAERTVRLMSSRMREGTSLEGDFEEVPRLVARSGELEQVLVNLTDNAIRALGGTGRVTVRVKVEGREIVVSVKDDGCGMSPDTKARALDPFFTTRPAGEGSGLGLSIVASIVRSHHGRIEIASEEGRGTEVVLRFPVDAPPPS